MGMRSRRTSPLPPRTGPAAGWSSSTTCLATTGPRRRSCGGSPNSATTRSARTCTGVTRPEPRPTTPPPPRGPTAACPTTGSSATWRRCRAPALAAEVERKDRRDRVLLGRPPGRAGRVQPRSRSGRRLLRRVRRRHATGGPPGHQPRRSAAEPACPLLGLFGNEDQHPSPEQVDELDEILTDQHKPHEFHRYDDAGHAFFSVDRPAYRVAAANDGWEQIAAFYATHLGG